MSQRPEEYLSEYGRHYFEATEAAAHALGGNVPGDPAQDAYDSVNAKYGTDLQPPVNRPNILKELARNKLVRTALVGVIGFAGYEAFKGPDTGDFTEQQVRAYRLECAQPKTDKPGPDQVITYAPGTTIIRHDLRTLTVTDSDPSVEIEKRIHIGTLVVCGQRALPKGEAIRAVVGGSVDNIAIFGPQSNICVDETARLGNVYTEDGKVTSC